MLPSPNAVFVSNVKDRRDLTEQEVRGIASNPIYAGLGPYSRIVSDEEWVQSALRQIRQLGLPQFLVNMLFVLRETFKDIEWTIESEKQSWYSFENR